MNRDGDGHWRYEPTVNPVTNRAVNPIMPTKVGIHAFSSATAKCKP